MRTRLLALAPLALVALAACSPEKKAEKAFKDYEMVFEECKKITEEMGQDPGTAYCSKVGSMALEMSLEDTGLSPEEQKAAIEKWAKESDLGSYYADEAARELIPD